MSQETEENDGGAATSLCAKELMEGVDIGDSFIVNQGENVTSREANDNDNVFIFTNENWGPEIDRETGLEVT